VAIIFPILGYDLELRNWVLLGKNAFSTPLEPKMVNKYHGYYSNITTYMYWIGYTWSHAHLDIVLTL